MSNAKQCVEASINAKLRNAISFQTSTLLAITFFDLSHILN